jgi:hypothetical protein
MMAEAVLPDIASAIIFGAVRGRWAEPAHRRGCLLTGRHIFGVAGGLMDVSTDDTGSSEGNPGTRRTQNQPSKECHHANEAELHDTTIGFGRCSSCDHCRTDCVSC